MGLKGCRRAGRKGGMNRMDPFSERRREMTLAVEAIRARDPRYDAKAYFLVVEAVERVLSGMAERRHISGAELCSGIRKLAASRFGPMAKIVLNYWGVRSTEDFGVIVFDLVEAGVLLKTDEDRMEDFLGVYDFAEAFESNYFEP
jgi:uncharacterized repeat protein (TIGR04138 family)